MTKILIDEALDKMAENARELGLDYMEGSAEQEAVAWALEWTFNGEEVGRRLYDDETHCKFDAGQDGGVCRPLVYGDTTPPAPAQERPQNCGTGYCSCIECLYEQPAPAQDADHMEDVLAMVERPTK